jgi:hypothetical protein
MPWQIRENTSQCSGYGVFKEGTNELEGCHATRGEAEGQMAALYASEPSAAKSVDSDFEKYRGDLYAKLTDEEKAFHDALLRIAQEYGPFDQGTSSIWVGYVEGEENEDANIGVMCANCSFFNPENQGCAILSYKVQPTGKCRLAAIPDGYVTPEMEEEEDEEEEMEDMMKPTHDMGMDKAESVRVGQMVSWNSSGGRAEGRVRRVIRDGSYNVPDSDFTINGTPDNPAAVIELYRDGKPTGRMVGHRVGSLTAKKSAWAGMFDPRLGMIKRG